MTRLRNTALIFFYFINRLVVIKTMFRDWYYFRLQVKGGQKPNLLGPLVELVTNLHQVQV
jgi:hypothetical protein